MQACLRCGPYFSSVAYQFFLPYFTFNFQLPGATQTVKPALIGMCIYLYVLECVYIYMHAYMYLGEGSADKAPYQLTSSTTNMQETATILLKAVLGESSKCQFVFMNKEQLHKIIGHIIYRVGIVLGYKN